MKTLKYFILSIGVLYSTIGFSQAQFGGGPTTFVGSPSTSSFEFGLQGGLNICTINNLQQGMTATSNTGFHIGGFINYEMSTNFDLQVGCIYTQLGGTVSLSQAGQDSVSVGTTNVFANISETQSTQITLGYIQFPINLVHKFGEGWNVHFGAYIGFLLSDKEHSVDNLTISAPSIGTQSADTNYNTNTTVGDNRIDFGINLGIGYRMQSGLGIDFTYAFGLTNIFQAQSGYDPTYGTYSYPAWASNVCYAFTLSYLLK